LGGEGEAIQVGTKIVGREGRREWLEVVVAAIE
jgi:hypothetical protein